MSDDQYFGTARPMTGFFAHLTPEQKKSALEYRGPDSHGDPAFALPTIGQTWTDPATGQEVMVVRVGDSGTLLDGVTAALVMLAKYGVPTDIQECLVSGRAHGPHPIKPGALAAAMLALLRAKEGK